MGTTKDLLVLIILLVIMILILIFSTIILDTIAWQRDTRCRENGYLRYEGGFCVGAILRDGIDFTQSIPYPEGE